MSTWEMVTWATARAGGLIAYALLTLSVVLGLALSLRWQRPRWPRLITNDLHRYLTVLSLVFIAVHGLAILLDPYMRFGWNEVLVPLASHYRPLWMAPGIVAAYLALAIWLSSELRPHIGYTWWRRLHTLTFAVYALATVHGIATGSDTRTPWGLAFYGGSALLVGLLLVYRLLTPIGARGRTYPDLAGLVALLILGGAYWTVNGPAAQGWNAIANNGHGNGARAPAASAAASTTSRTSGNAGIFTAPFNAAVQGTATQSAPDADGNTTITLNLTVGGGASGALRVALQGTPNVDGSVSVTAGQLTLSGPAGPPRYLGSLQQLTDTGGGTHIQATLRGPNGRTLTIDLLVQMTADGHVGGTVQGEPL